MSDLQRVNGAGVSWGDLVFKVDDEEYYGFTSVAFGQKLETVFGYGMGKHHAPTRQSAGKYSTEPIKVTGYVGAVQALREALARKSPSGKNYGKVRFSGVLQYISEGEAPITVEFFGCRFTEETNSHEEAPDLLKEEFTLTCMRMKKNGLALYDDSEGEP